MPGWTMRRLGITLLMAAVVGGPAVASAKTLRIGVQADAGTMDPQAQNIQTTITLLSMVYESLVTRDNSLAKSPMLALRWSQTDPTTWRFILRPGVKFQDGSKFGSADVAFSIQRAQGITTQFSSFVAGLQTRIIDELTIDIVSPRPDPLLPDKLIYIAMMNRAWSEAHNALAPQDLTQKAEPYTAQHANGTGPYELISRAVDSRTVLARSRSYWGHMEGDIDEIVWLPIKNDPTRTAALLSGELDLLIDVPSQDAARLAQSPAITLAKVPEFRTVFFGFDLKNDKLKYGESGGRNPFKDRRVRQAVDLAIDRDLMVRNVMRGFASPTAQILAPNNVGYDPALDKGAEHNLPEARRLLAEAGFPAGFSVTLDCPNDRYINDELVCRTMATMLAQIGLKVDLDTMSRVKYFPKLWERDTSMFMMGFNSPFFDGMYALENLVMTRNDADGAGVLNYESFSDPAFDAAIAAARIEMDPSKRAAMLTKIYRIVTDEKLYVAVYNQLLVYAMRKGVSTPVRPDNWLEIRWVTMD